MLLWGFFLRSETEEKQSAEKLKVPCEMEILQIDPFLAPILYCSSMRGSAGEGEWGSVDLG